MLSHFRAKKGKGNKSRVDQARALLSRSIFFRIFGRVGDGRTCNCNYPRILDITKEKINRGLTAKRAVRLHNLTSRYVLYMI